MTDLAPYPRTEADATADALARFLTVQAYRTLAGDVPRLQGDWEDAGRPEFGPLRDAYDGAVRAATSEYATVYLLRDAQVATQELFTLTADELSREVYPAYDGHTAQVVEDLHGWLIEYGIDPAAVVAEAVVRA